MIDLAEARDLLRRAPDVLRALYNGLGRPWLFAGSDPVDWSAHSVLVHLVKVEERSWADRVRHILDHGAAVPTEPVDRGGPELGLPVGPLLDEFAARRARNLELLDSLGLTAADLERCGDHPEFGSITIGNVVATWAVHDLNHMGQALSAIAKRYRDEVGPFVPNLGILGPP